MRFQSQWDPMLYIYIYIYYMNLLSGGVGCCPSRRLSARWRTSCSYPCCRSITHWLISEHPIQSFIIQQSGERSTTNRVTSNQTLIIQPSGEGCTTNTPWLRIVLIPMLPLGVTSNHNSFIIQQSDEKSTMNTPWLQQDTWVSENHNLYIHIYLNVHKYVYSHICRYLYDVDTWASA
jgi:hypothetical protein